MMAENGQIKIKNFDDLKVYQRLYELMLIVLKDIIPCLPKEEKYDLADQIRRCCKAGPALIAEGFAKRYQPRAWKKYLDDTIGESNEMIHHLSVCRDVYSQAVSKNMIEKLISGYDIANKQLYSLKKTWVDYHKLSDS